MNRQSVIPLETGADYSLARFVTGHNEALVMLLSSLSADNERPQLIYLFGEPGSGKTHLLHGVVELAKRASQSTRYLRLDTPQSIGLGNEIKPGSFICADDLTPATMTRERAVELLSLYEQTARAGATLLIASRTPPEAAKQVLPDLASRLASGLVFQVQPLDDEGRRSALKQNAAARGFELEDGVASFILRHYSRDTGSLFALMDRIDSASLATHRRVTVPFIRDLISAT